MGVLSKKEATLMVRLKKGSFDNIYLDSDLD